MFSRAFFEKRKHMDAKKSGKKIKLSRIELDLTQTELPHKITAQQKSISPYETGAPLLFLETVVELPKVLKKRASYFLDE